MQQALVEDLVEGRIAPEAILTTNLSVVMLLLGLEVGREIGFGEARLSGPAPSPAP